jgi:hypothetical protein
MKIVRVVSSSIVVALAGCTQNFGVFEPRDGAAGADAAKEGGADASAMDTGGGDGAACTGTVYMGHCYYLVNSASWATTSGSCMGSGGHLVTIGDVGEQMAVQALGMGDRWIGLSRMMAQPAVDMSYVWVTGEARTYSNWAMGEPNGSGTSVRLRFDGTWSDTSEMSQNVGICERP